MQPVVHMLSFGVKCKVKHNAPTNKPTNISNSFDETATASVVNLGVNSLQAESKTDKYSRSSGRTQG